MYNNKKQIRFSIETLDDLRYSLLANDCFEFLEKCIVDGYDILIYNHHNDKAKQDQTVSDITHLLRLKRNLGYPFKNSV